MLKLTQLPEYSILFSLDLVSLYTNIPTDMGLLYIEAFLKTIGMKTLNLVTKCC